MTTLDSSSSGTADFSAGEVYFIGIATTLIRFGGLTILTDPTFLYKGEHVHLGHGIWARREGEPGLPDRRSAPDRPDCVAAQRDSDPLQRLLCFPVGAR